MTTPSASELVARRDRRAYRLRKAGDGGILVLRYSPDAADEVVVGHAPSPAQAAAIVFKAIDQARRTAVAATIVTKAADRARRAADTE